MNLLAFDTSTECLAVAVCSGQDLLLSTQRPGGAQASAELIPQAQALLNAAGLSWQTIDAIAFGCGPGAFTGLRTSCAVAQGLALGLSRPVLPISSLLIVAEDAWAQTGVSQGHYAVAMDARMNESYATCWQRVAVPSGVHTHEWRAVSAPALYTLPALHQAWSGLAVDVLCGSALAAFAGVPAFAGLQLELEAAALAQQRALLKVPDELSRARALMRLAQAAWLRGEGQDAAQAQPVYLRDKVALTTAERQAAKAKAKELA